MKVSFEILTHLQCEKCEAWWSAGDRPVELGQLRGCPECFHVGTITEMQNGKYEPVTGVAWVKPVAVRPPIVLDAE